MSVQYALVSRTNSVTTPTGVKPVHHQCGTKLEPVPGGSGLYACNRCLKTGYLVQADT